MDSNSSEERQLEARMTVVEQRLAKVEEVLQGVVEKMGTKLETDMQHKLSILIPKVEELLACHQCAPFTLSQAQAQFPPPQVSSLPAIASSSNSPSSLDIFPLSTASGNPTAASLLLACHQCVPFSLSQPQSQFPPAQVSSLPAIASSSNSPSPLNILPASTAADNPAVQSFQASLGSSRDSSGSLFQAAEKGDLAVLNFFLAAGEEVNARDKSNNTALHLAASNGRTVVAGVLIANGAVMHCSGNHRRTPLHCAAANGHMAMVVRLVSAGVPVDARDAEGATAVCLAACEGHEAVVRYLLEQGASIHIAAGNGETPLLMAVKNRRSDVVKLLLRTGALPTTKNHEGESPLSLASAGSHVDILEDLLQNVQQFETEEIIRFLTKAGSAEVVRMFASVALNIVLGPAGEEACRALAREGRQEVLLALLQLGVNVNATNAFGITGLHLAAVRGHTSCVQTLILAGAQVNAKDVLGRTPLALAAKEECIVALEESGAV